MIGKFAYEFLKEVSKNVNTNDAGKVLLGLGGVASFGFLLKYLGGLSSSMGNSIENSNRNRISNAPKIIGNNDAKPVDNFSLFNPKNMEGK